MIAYSQVCENDGSLYREYLATCREFIQAYRGQAGDTAQFSQLIDKLEMRLDWRPGVEAKRDSGIARGLESDRRGPSGSGGSESGVEGDGGGVEPGETSVRSTDRLGEGCEGEVEQRGSISVDVDVGRDLRVHEDEGSELGAVHGKSWKRNHRRRRREKVGRSTGASVVGSVCTVDTRTGVEIEAAQTLAVRRVAENELAVEKAKAEKLLVQHRIRALEDKDRTKAVQKLAAARMEESINKSKKNSEAYFKDCEQSLKSLGSTGSAGEFALKQQIKDARETELLLKYTKAQADMYAIYATPDVLAKVAALPPPVIQDEFEAFGDCPDYYTEGEREQYYADLNRRNAEKVDYCDTGDAW